MRKAHLNKLLTLIALSAALYFGWQELEPPDNPASRSEQGDGSLQDNFDNRTSGSQVQGSGTVIKLLPDDNDGSRHQRFILRLDSGRTLLVAHNIDLAPRIASLRVGDTVAFNGEFEWNEKGGIIHWTHHDPAGRHVTGWLKHDGRRYQ